MSQVAVPFLVSFPLGSAIAVTEQSTQASTRDRSGMMGPEQGQWGLEHSREFMGNSPFQQAEAEWSVSSSPG